MLMVYINDLFPILLGRVLMKNTTESISCHSTSEALSLISGSFITCFFRAILNKLPFAGLRE